MTLRAIAALLLFAAACATSYGTADDGTPDAAAAAPPEIDGSPADAGGRALEASASAGDAMTANLLVNGDFELGECVGWLAIGATLQSATDNPHGGLRACRVCPTGAGSVSISQRVAIPALSSTTAFVTGWVRSDGPVSLTVSAQVSGLDVAGNIIDLGSGVSQPPASFWRPLPPAVLQISPGTSSVSAEVIINDIFGLGDGGDAGVGDCVVIDDVTLTLSQ